MSDNPLSTDTSSLISRAKGIVLSPKAEWPKIALETKSPKEVLLQYALPLAVITPVCSVLGSLLSPYGGLGLTYYLISAVVSFLLSLASLYALAFVANTLGPNFGGKNDFASAFKLVAYSWTPVYLAGVLGLISGLSLGLATLLGLVGFAALIYGLYLFYLGTGPVMAIPQDKSLVYVVIYVVCAIVLYLIVGAITGVIVASFITTPAAVVIYS